ncbi:MAG: bifunctional diaminohydroxyphosphoribosylaminopyrimidine deaminase/5-amino-6-(5-phosphoribosylamino)uracil reductase RibD, partial [Sedimentisphaerales bacterium]|nr:bifunctional diaminohydroxyphosphoribosylaminopyrimidine deaminase/5-amino-6-(5-phosphoribosylamino)uracil reductase RibD [Sedimentisphaerales bacterium]
FGGPHAEVNAIEDCRKLAVRPEGGTMYVTLEPCCHEGKTGPCTEAIIGARLARVVVATMDPSEHARGKGVEELRRAGIEVQVGLCEEEAKRLNAPFFKYAQTGKPWVVLKWAQSLDGKLAFATPSEQMRWISNEASRRDAHKLRRRVGAVVVGINTVLADDPLLTPRPSKGRKPLRVVLDNALRIPLKARLLRTTKSCPVLICTKKSAVEANLKHADRIKKRGAEVVAYDETDGVSSLRFLVEELGRRGAQQVLIEGGPHVLTSFLREGLVDEVCVYIAPQILGAAGAAYVGAPMAELVRAVNLDHVDITAFDGDVRISGLPRTGAAQEVRPEQP